MRLWTMILSLGLLAGLAQAETFTFPKHGFALDGPDGWVVLSHRDLGRILGDSDFGSEEANRGATSPDASLLLSIAETRNPVGVAGGIFVNLRSGRITDLTEAGNNVLARLTQNAIDFQILFGPDMTILGSFRAGVIRYRYTINSKGNRFRVEETLWIVPMEGKFLTISGGSAPEDEVAKALVRITAESLRALLP